MGPLDLPYISEYAGTAIVLAFLFAICSHKPLAILQQSGYKNKKMLAWYARRENMLLQQYCLLALMLLLAAGLLGICFAFLGEEWAFRITGIPFLFFCILFCIVDRKYALKVPFNPTPRFKRLTVVYFFVLAVVFYLLVAVLNVIAYYAESELFGVWRYVPLAVIPFALPVLACLANLIASPFERAHNKKYVARAKEKLEKSGMLCIGITGSFAKTSVKHILAAMLREKYSVLATPASYNTPMGVAKCINEYEGEPCEVFIAEMGARNKGDIAELCELVHPRYSVLTGICAQHVESFGSLANVIAAKSEIFAGTAADGFVVVGMDENTEKAAENACGREIVRVDETAVKDVASGENGTSFTLVTGEGEVRIETKLLGRHTAKNIALAAALALRLGVSGEQIAAACRDLDYVPHRLQVIKNGAVTVLDDSYNANPVGAADAVEGLKSFSGWKIVVTPGLVELGILQSEENEEFGKILVGLDEVVLVGDTLVGAVKSGYLSGGGDEEKVHVYPTLQAAQAALPSLIGAGGTVLFLNDLPDIYC